MRRIHLHRVLSSATAFIAVVALAFGRPDDVEMAALAVFAAIIGRA